jgi:nitroreductase
MEYFHCVHTRRSVRKYQSVPVEFEKVGRIIEAAFQTPSAGNVQDFRFVLVQDDAKRAKIAEACLQQYWMEQAPVHILVSIDIKRAKQFYGIRGERLYSPQHAGAVMQTMLLAAHAQGLGACWVGGFDEAALKNVCGVPEYARPQGVITIGYADEIPPRPPKYLVETFTYIEKYNNKIANIPPAITEWSPVWEQGVRSAVAGINKGTNSMMDKVVAWLKTHQNKFSKHKKKK